jgi:hypothetical protein
MGRGGPSVDDVVEPSEDDVRKITRERTFKAGAW